MNSEPSRAREYQGARYRLFFIDLGITLAVLLIFELSGISKTLYELISGRVNNFFLSVICFATALGIILYLAGALIHYYKSFVLEHRFDLSNQRFSAWIKDELKGTAISYLLFLLFACSLYFFLKYFRAGWWIWMAGAWILFNIIFAKLVPIIIIPLFFKYRELENKHLRKRLIDLAKRCKVKVVDVFKIDLSAKTKKANAALTGLGSTRRILLGDTLLENFTEEEIEVVLAHELAHHRFGHIWKQLMFGGIAAFILFFLIHVTLKIICPFLGISELGNVRTFPSIIFLLTIFSIAILPVQNWHSRAMEKEADISAIKMTNLVKAFISCMNKLGSQNLADPLPSKFIEIMLYDHPPIFRRVKLAERLEKGRIR